MTVAIGPVLLLLASLLLSAVLVLAAFCGLILWMGRDQRRTRGESERRVWQHDPTDIAGPDGTSIVVPGK